MGVLSHLKPRAVLRFFEEICGIPHGSGHTELISGYLVRFARERGLKYLQDESGNVIIWKEGTDGYEKSDAVMLQGHIDMVCEKEPGCAIDFERDGLTVLEKDGIITAEGTTLGGDDGIAVAYALAVLDSDDIPHPPLEAVFTVDEEIGMLGAAALDMSPLRARYMLNIDSEDEGYLLTSCAGGATALCRLDCGMEPVPDSFAGPYRLKVAGCLGGHSGIEIDKGRANANLILGRALYRLSSLGSLRLIRLAGGKKDNAIPAEAEAEFVMGAAAAGSAGASESEALLRAQLDLLNEELKNEFDPVDPGVRVELEVVTAGGEQLASELAASAELPISDGALSAMTLEASRRVITALICLPAGVQRMSFAIPGLVQTSLNMGILETVGAAETAAVSMSYSVRSSLDSEKRELIDRMSALMNDLGGSVSCSGDYPAWEYRSSSRLRDLMVEVFEKQYGRKPVVQAIHAGVECGLFAGKMPGLDCISFGPDMTDIHTPRESLDAASVRRTWDYLLEVLRELK